MRTVDKIVIAISSTIIVLAIGVALISSREEPIDWSAMDKGVNQHSLPLQNVNDDPPKKSSSFENSDTVWVHNAGVFIGELSSPLLDAKSKYEGKTITIDHFKYSDQVETDISGNVTYYPLLVVDHDVPDKSISLTFYADSTNMTVNTKDWLYRNSFRLVGRLTEGAGKHWKFKVSSAEKLN